MVKFMIRGTTFADGSLKDRMIGEGLPQVLEFKQAQNGRIERNEYQCSEGLAIALLSAGADLEFTQWSEDVLEYRKTWNC